MLLANALVPTGHIKKDKFRGVSALIHESQTAPLAKEGKAALDPVEPGDDATGKNRKFTLVQIVEYCKDCVNWADAAPIVAMLNKLVRGTATPEDSELIDSAENMFKKHDKGNTFTVKGGLASPKAKIYWEKLEKKGFVDNNCKLMPGVSRMEAMYIAKSFAEKLKLESKWKPFEELWSLKNMAQDSYKRDASNSTVRREADIDEVFKD